MRYHLLRLMFVLVFSGAQVRAQEESLRTKHFIFGLGSSHFTVRDISASPLRYSGLGLQAQLGHEWQSDQRFQRLSLNFQAAGLSNPVSYISSIRAYAGSLAYTYLQRLYASDQLNWGLGGMVDLWGNFRPNKRRDNNPLSYDAGTSLSFATNLNKPVSLASKNLDLDFSLSVPLLSYLMRPSWGIPYPENYLVEGVYNPRDKGIAGPFLTSGKLASVDKFLRIQSNFGLTYPLKPGKDIRLNYNWDFYTINSVKRVQLADQSLLVSLLLNFNK